ncbi:hypothetical protein [Amorphus orientalis]|uniref:Uncharacterized protein n=1 Tax=Amorphus orientalis TaxID=649198 RepID=A0AAE4ASU7_9HYPH|nr:hypothetical protein [Amorphus orientalis]MDQ0315643.1 hypothetical protein [Amorphus orientalis]
MPQLVFLALAAGAAYVGSRWMKREMARVDKRMRPARADDAERGRRLQQDPETGIYRPERIGQ